MTAVNDGAWERLAAAVLARRISLRLSQAQIAAESGTSERTVRLLEKAERRSYHPSTLRGISQALGWTPESIHQILDGGEASEPRSTAESDEGETLEQAVDRLEREVALLKARLDERQRNDQPT